MSKNSNNPGARLDESGGRTLKVGDRVRFTMLYGTPTCLTATYSGLECVVLTEKSRYNEHVVMFDDGHELDAGVPELTPLRGAGRRDMTDRAAETFSRDAVLTIQQVASALGVSVRTVERADLPTVYLGKRTRRFIWGDVLDALKGRAA
jgi:hypothetical protein